MRDHIVCRPQDEESSEDVQEQLRREWGTVSMENSQDEYEVDTAELQSKVGGTVNNGGN